VRLGIEFEYERRHDPVPSFSVTLTWPHYIKGWGWGWRCKVWRFYV
jgi:hypothetical protein